MTNALAAPEGQECWEREREGDKPQIGECGVLGDGDGGTCDWNKPRKSKGIIIHGEIEPPIH